MVQLGILFAADPEQAEVDQPDGAGRDAVTIQATSRQVRHGGRPQRRQNAGEPQHVKELLSVALFAPLLVVAVLDPAPAVHAGGLDVAQRVRRDPDVRPGRRDHQRADALQRLPLRDLRARRVAVPETFPTPLAGDPRATRIAACQAWNRSRQRRCTGAHTQTAYMAPARRHRDLASPTTGSPTSAPSLPPGFAATRASLAEALS